MSCFSTWCKHPIAFLMFRGHFLHFRMYICMKALWQILGNTQGVTTQISEIFKVKRDKKRLVHIHIYIYIVYICTHTLYIWVNVSINKQTKTVYIYIIYVNTDIKYDTVCTTGIQTPGSLIFWGCQDPNIFKLKVSSRLGCIVDIFL